MPKPSNKYVETIAAESKLSMTGSAVKKLREGAMLTQMDLAQYLGYANYQRVQEIEDGKYDVSGARARLLYILSAAVRGRTLEISLNPHVTLQISSNMKRAAGSKG